MTKKERLLSELGFFLSFLLLSLFAAAKLQAQNSLVGPQVTVQTDGTRSDGAVNIGTQNAGEINFYTNNTKRLTLSSSGVLSGTALTGLAPVLANDTYLTSTNAAGSGTLDLLKGSSTDNTVLNAKTGKTINLSIAGTSEVLVGDDSLLFAVTAAGSPVIGTSSVDATDSNTLIVTSGSAAATDGSRGATAYFRGNEVASVGGSMTLLAGNAATAQLTLAIEHASSAVIFKDITTGTLWSITDAGVLTQDGTNGGALQFNATTSLISIGTTDATDNKSLIIEAGSTSAVDASRGGTIILRGNEVASTGGNVVLIAGNASTANLDLDVENASSAIRFRDLTTGTLWSISDAGVLASDATNGAGIQMGQTTSIIGTDTADAADNKSLFLSGTTGTASDGSRGGLIILRGNEVASTGGTVNVFAGNASTANVNFFVENASSVFNFRDITTGILFTVEDDGDLVQEATNGGNLIMAKAGKGVLLGATTADADVITLSIAQPHLYISDASATENQVAIVERSAGASGAIMRFYKTRASATDDANTIVVSGDTIATIGFNGADGADYKQAASIRAIVDGTPGTNDMPGALIFATKLDGAASTTDQLKIGNDGLAAFTGKITSAATTDLGWSVVDQTDNQACNTGCTSACVFGFAVTAGNVTGLPLSCTDTNSDICLCAGSS